MKVCLVIPCFNEAKAIGDVVKGAKKVFGKSSHDFEIVVINDGSRDNSSEIARKSGVTVIDHILNQGAGGATLTGLSYARNNAFDYAITIDADGQHDPNDALSCFLQAVETKSDLLIGSRMINTSGMSKVKVIGNRGLSLITGLLFGVNVTDSQSGLRVFSRKALDNLTWKSTGYEFTSETIWRAKQARLGISEYPIRAIYTDYSRAKGQNNWNAINILKSLVKQRIVELFE